MTPRERSLVERLVELELEKAGHLGLSPHRTARVIVAAFESIASGGRQPPALSPTGKRRRRDAGSDRPHLSLGIRAERVDQIHELFNGSEQLSYREIGRRVGVSDWTVRRVLERDTSAS